jgi:Domain of unknown function (DUF929)
MRAQIRKRQRMRRITILVTVLIIVISIGVGVYFVAMAGGESQWDKLIGQPVSTSDLSSLMNVSGQPYGPAATTTMQSAVQNYGGTPFVSAGKPTVVFIGGEYCMYCAAERWSIIMALMRFGTFSGITYMSAAPDENDYATFSFVGSSYTSQYISFRPYEAFDRNEAALQTVPSNYSSIWEAKGGGVPFLDFGNTYLITSSLIADPSILSGKNQTAIIADISASDGTGLVLREAANLITAAICKVTQGAPLSVCSASPISSETSLISGPVSGGLALEVTSLVAPMAQPEGRPALGRLR